MVQVSTQPVNVISNQWTSVVPPGAAIGYGTIACVIYNTTPVVLQVFHSGGTTYIQPDSADAVPCISGVYPTVTPVITNLPLALVNTGEPIYVGTVTATFYDLNDGWPTGYPQAIVPFSGGALLTGSNITGLIYYILVVPQGTIQLTFNAIYASTGKQLTVIGYTSATTYYLAVVNTGQTVNIAIPAANNDTIFYVTTGFAGCIYSIYATG